MSSAKYSLIQPPIDLPPCSASQLSHPGRHQIIDKVAIAGGDTAMYRAGPTQLHGPVSPTRCRPTLPLWPCWLYGLMSAYIVENGRNISIEASESKVSKSHH